MERRNHTIPPTGRFIITQICANEGPTTIQGSASLGTLFVANGNGDGCTRFQPGLAVPPNEALTFIHGEGTSVTVMMTGVLSKK